MKKVVKVLSLFRSIMLIPVMISIMNSYEIMKQIKYFGVIFYALSIVLIIIGIIGMLNKNHNMNKFFSYNVIFILLEVLIAISAIIGQKAIATGIMMDFNIYFQVAYLSFSLLIIGICVNTCVIKKIKNTKKGLL